MTRQTAVHKCVVGVKQICDRVILADHAVEKQFGFAPHGTRKVFVEVRKNVDVRQDVFQVLQPQPLAAEVTRQRLERGSPSIRLNCCSNTAGSCRRFSPAMRSSSASGAALHRKKERRWFRIQMKPG